MPTLAICRRADPGRGFTLLELLIVLALFGLLTALTVPRFVALYDSLNAAHQRDEALRQIAGLGYRAFQKGQELVVGVPAAGTAPQQWSLPDGWSIQAKPPIRYYRNGACSGGVLEVTSPQGVERLVLVPPLCRPQASAG